MRYRQLGKTGLQVSAVAFGAGPVPGLMTRERMDDLGADTQLAAVRRAIQHGINWFDTAATYGDGKSETQLGRVLRQADTDDRIHVATKVRIPPDELSDIRGSVLRSCEASLCRLDRPCVTLLQLHNSITTRRGEQPTSLSVDDVLGSQGVLEAMQELRQAGHILHFGLTGIGTPSSLAEVIRSSEFATIQTPFNVLNPSAGQLVKSNFSETNYDNQFAECVRHGMGVFAIRVFAGGALVGQEPSAHTRQTKFFPMDLYRRDERLADQLRAMVGSGSTIPEIAVRYVLQHSAVSAAIIGFSSPDQIDQVVRWADEGPLSNAELDRLRAVLNY